MSGRSSVGRVPALEAGCRRFDPYRPDQYYAPVVKLADTPVLETGAERREGSSPSGRTIKGVWQRGLMQRF